MVKLNREHQHSGNSQQNLIVYFDFLACNSLEASAPGDEMSNSGRSASLSAYKAARDSGGGETDSVRRISVQKLSRAV